MQKNKQKLNEVHATDFIKPEIISLVKIVRGASEDMQKNHWYLNQVDDKAGYKFANYIQTTFSKVANELTDIVYGDYNVNEMFTKLTLTVKPLYNIQNAQYNQKDNTYVKMLNSKLHSQHLNSFYELLKHYREWMGESFMPKYREIFSFFKQQTNENKQQTIMKIKAKDLKKVIRENKSKDLSKNSNQTKKSIKVGDLKRKLNEAKLGFGLGFKNQNSAFDETDNIKPIKKPINKDRQIGGQGSAMLGQGFALQEALKGFSKNPSKLVNLVEGIVKQLKGKSDYTNLNFVNKVAKKYNISEGEIKKMKTIILKENSPKTAIRLYNYITECSCRQAEDVYGQYNGLKQPSMEMLPNIKRTFNKYQGSMPTPQAAMASTSSNLKIPMEMVEEMYEVQKEAKKMKLEGSGKGNIAEMDGKLQGIYEKYQKMSEGDMFEMYDEMAEYMDYPSSDDIVMNSLSDDKPIQEYDDFDGSQEYDDRGINNSQEYDDRGLSPRQALEKTQKNINTEIDDYWAYGTHAGTEDVYTDEDILDIDADDQGVIEIDNLEDDDQEPIDIHRFDDAFDLDNNDDIWLDEEVSLEEGVEDHSHQIQAMNPRTGEMTAYRIDVTDEGYMVEGGDDFKYVTIRNGQLLGGESLPEEVRQHILTIYENGSDTTTADEENQFSEKDWNY